MKSERQKRTDRGSFSICDSIGLTVKLLTNYLPIEEKHGLSQRRNSLRTSALDQGWGKYLGGDANNPVPLKTGFQPRCLSLTCFALSFYLFSTCQLRLAPPPRKWSNFSAVEEPPPNAAPTPNESQLLLWAISWEMKLSVKLGEKPS